MLFLLIISLGLVALPTNSTKLKCLSKNRKATQPSLDETAATHREISGATHILRRHGSGIEHAYLLFVVRAKRGHRVFLVSRYYVRARKMRRSVFPVRTKRSPRDTTTTRRARRRQFVVVVVLSASARFSFGIQTSFRFWFSKQLHL